jgi:hypothetical protein
MERCAAWPERGPTVLSTAMEMNARYCDGRGGHAKGGLELLVVVVGNVSV